MNSIEKNLNSAEGGERVEVIDTAMSRAHLKDGFKPIMACVGANSDFMTSETPNNILRIMNGVDLENAHDVDYYAKQETLQERGFKIPEKRSYVISPVDALDKFSKSFVNCTGLLATGKDKKTGEDISFLSHQDPTFFLSLNGRDEFVADIGERLRELRNRSVEGSVDAVILGGSYYTEPDLSPKGSKYNGKFNSDYIESIKLLAAEVEKSLGFEPIVIIGPKVAARPEYDTDNVFYDTKNRRIYIAREKVGLPSTSGFAPKDISTFEKEWREENHSE